MATQTAVKNAASEKQIAFIRTLQEERSIPVLDDVGAGQLTKKAASALIEQLLATKPAGPAVSLVEMAKAITHGVPVDAAPVAPVEPAAATQYTLTLTREHLRAISGAFMVEDAEVGEHTPAGDEVLAMISAVLHTAQQATATATTPQVPDGRYAVKGEDGSWDFYKVETGKPGGKWAGFRFVSQQLSDDFVPVKAPGVKAAVLAKIAADPLAAAKAYGHELGVCGICAKTLTDPASIAAGIGPVCAAKLGA